MVNKVKLNICNVHYALFNKAEEDAIRYKIPALTPGAVSTSLDPNGEPESFYVDETEYYAISNDMRYDGDLETVLIPEPSRTGISMEKSDSNKILIESSNSKTANSALLFELGGSQKKIRYVMYNCPAVRSTLEGETNEESRGVQPETLSIQARPLPNGNVKARTDEETAKETYDGWHKSVYMPTETTVIPSRASVGGK